MNFADPLSVLHALCAGIYTGMAVMIAAQSGRSRLGILLALAAAVTAVWAGAVAAYSDSPYDGLVGWLALARGVAWGIFLLSLYNRSFPPAWRWTYPLLLTALTCVLGFAALPAMELMAENSEAGLAPTLLARLGVAIVNVLVLENLYFNNNTDGRWKLRLLAIPLGAIFIYDVALYADAMLFHRLSPVLFIGRASVTMLAAPLIALAVARNRVLDVRLFVSRGVVFHSATLVASGLFLLSLAFAGEILRQTGSSWGVVAEISLICGGLLFVLVVLTSGTARSYAYAWLAEHFFTQRYDYRAEWTRCIAMLSSTEGGAGLQTRAIRAAAQIADSPAGALFQRDPAGVVFQWTGSWNQPAATQPLPLDHALISALKGTDAALLLDRQPAAVLAGLGELPRPWLAVPLIHLDALVGFVLLAPPRAPLRVTPEVRNLLGIVGSEVASRLAEHQATRALAETRQLQDYSKRFAFVLHDIKNVSGQLSMLVANAEHHLGNPAFQRDMLVTLRAAVDRIGAMQNKLHRARDPMGAAASIEPAGRLARILDDRPQLVVARDIDIAPRRVAMDADAFDSLVGHLLDNASEAMAGQANAELRVWLRHDGWHMMIDIIDNGPGMSPEFIRDQLFAPLRSTKRRGQGIGVFQARELLRGVGGDLLAISTVGLGTTMRIVMPLVAAPGEVVGS